ncbi:helix-hairpin-helix domain-containing protein [Sagittula sp. NFXS13]|uniref:helix-hairpin-helix domain-containing protein n=1 Tax=Sagittula sp. NFXS13 TaxID=2819095 RepID=UPI0032DEED96
MVKLLDVRGIGPAMERDMKSLGLSTPDAVARAEPQDLCALPRVQLARARMLIAAAKEALGQASSAAVEDAEDDGIPLIPSADPSIDLEILEELKAAKVKIKPAKGGKKKKNKKKADKATKSSKKAKKDKQDKADKKARKNAKTAKESAARKMAKAGKSVSAKSSPKSKKKKKKDARAST